jgi:hypothetical protein
MCKSCLRLTFACLFLAALPSACSDSSTPAQTGSGGSGGSGSGGSGGSSTGGTTTGSGGSATGGTTTGSGGSATGGTTTGSGGSSTGGTTTGSGGAATGGASGGRGGTTTGNGGAATGGAAGSGGTVAGGAGGTAAGGEGGTAAGGEGGTSAGGAGGTSPGDASAGGSGGSQPDARDTGGGGDPFAADGKVAQNGNRWTITMGTVVLEVGTDQAGMITAFSIDGTNFLVSNNASNGSVFWTAPQSDWDWPPPDEQYTSTYTASSANNVLTLTSPVGPVTKLSITKKIWGNVANQAVTIEYTIKNNGTAETKKAPWEITRVYPGGLTFFPNADEPVVLPGTSGSFLAVPFTTAAGAAWWKYQKSQFTQDIKGGAAASEGWAAQINCGSGLEQACPTTGASANKSIIMIKQWKPTTTEAPEEKEVEIYANAGHNYVEFEQQGDYQTIPAGGTITWTMHWLLRYLPSDVAPASGSADLLTWVRGQLL